jgi:hypothetical protein
MQEPLQPTPAGGAVGKLAISLIAKVFSQMQKLCTAGRETFQAA